MSTTWQIQQRCHRKTMPDCAAPYDVIVVGGGVNGAGVARDAAGRGARVLLLEAGDLAQGTSSKSTKLIHGGLRYLEHYERSEEHTSELQSLMRISYAVLCLKKK